MDHTNIWLVQDSNPQHSEARQSLKPPGKSFIHINIIFLRHRQINWYCNLVNAKNGNLQTLINQQTDGVFQKYIHHPASFGAVSLRHIHFRQTPWKYYRVSTIVYFTCNPDSEAGLHRLVIIHWNFEWVLLPQSWVLMNSLIKGKQKRCNVTWVYNIIPWWIG